MVVCSFKELQHIYSMLIQILTALQLKLDNSTPQQPSQQKIIPMIKQSVVKIHNQIVYSHHSFTGNMEEELKMYEQIEKDLQKQESINRQLIKKELEYKEYQKCLVDELNQQKNNVKKLKNQLDKVTQRIANKYLQINHLTNQNKGLAKNIHPPVQFMIDSKLNFDYAKLDKQTTNGNKYTHTRRRSDEVTRKVSTGNQKKKGSITKR